MTPPDPPDKEAQAFAAELQRREKAARGLERDLLYEVPLLYGSPSQFAPHGDPGVILAQTHRDALVARHDGGVPEPWSPLPSEEPGSYLTMAGGRRDTFTRFMRWLAFR